MVHPLELRLIDRALGEVDFVQLPVRPEIPEGGHAVAGHYCDEFAETHARSLVVRSALGAGVPAAGVSCGFGREMLERIRYLRADEGVVGPFAAECFTEDYELGMLIARLGGRSRFLRCRDAEGHLVGTRSYFPNTLVGAVRQKTRWMQHLPAKLGSAGLESRLADVWMMLRDRRGPLSALVLAVAYALLVVEALLGLARWHYGAAMPVLVADDHWLRIGLWVCVAGTLWRLVMRFAFTAHEYGLVQGLFARLADAAGQYRDDGRAARAAGLLPRPGGASLVWDKTEHSIHPATAAAGRQLGDRRPGSGNKPRGAACR
jgi:adsorption protein B